MTDSSSEGLRRLIYVSSASGRFDQADLNAILATSRANNSAHGLTGILLFHDGCFFQVLEGEAQSLQRTFTRISADARHAGVIVLERRDVKERSFPNWSMGYVNARALDPALQQWLVDLAERVASEDRKPLSEVSLVNDHIETFLSTFREFA